MLENFQKIQFKQNKVKNLKMTDILNSVWLN